MATPVYVYYSALVARKTERLYIGTLRSLEAWADYTDSCSPCYLSLRIATTIMLTPSGSGNLDKGFGVLRLFQAVASALASAIECWAEQISCNAMIRWNL